MNIYSFHIYSNNKILIHSYFPSNIYKFNMDEIIKIMNIDIQNYSAFEYENKIFHVLIKSNKIIIMCTNLSYPRRVGLKCLEEIDIHLISNNLIDLSKFYSKYNRYEKIDSISAVNLKVDTVKNIMHENIDKILENNVKLETIEESSQNLMQSAGIFSDQAKQLRQKLWWRNFRTKLYIGLAILVILGIIIGICVGMYKK